MIKGILSGYGFGGTGNYLVIDKLDGSASERTRTLISGKYMSVSVNTERRVCTWSYDLLSWYSTPCPHKRTVEKKYETCFDCRQKSGFNPAFYNVDKSSLSQQQRAYNEEPHLVYLAHFWDDIVKVWIANERRWRIRLLEQGARSASILWKFDNSYRARALEAAVSETGLVKERVMSATKSKFILAPYSIQNASNIMRKTILSINDRLGQTFPVNTDILSFEEEYFSSEFQNSRTLSRSSTMPAKTWENDAIEGSVMGLCGDGLVLARENSQQIVFLKSLFWYLVDIHISDTSVLKPTSEVQFSLF